MWRIFSLKHVIWKSCWKFYHVFQFEISRSSFFQLFQIQLSRHNSIKSNNNFWKYFWHDSTFYATSILTVNNDNWQQKIEQKIENAKSSKFVSKWINIEFIFFTLQYDLIENNKIEIKNNKVETYNQSLKNEKIEKA